MQQRVLKVRNSEKGQAITELLASVVAIMAVFLGLLFISALGIENIQCMINARANADTNAANGLIDDSGNPIREWSAGDDGLHFTADDSSTASDADAFAIVANEMSSTDGSFSLISGLNNDYVIYNFVASLPVTPLFLNAANLTSSTETQADPLGARQLGDLKGAFRSLILNEPDFAISQTVYMPIQ